MRKYVVNQLGSKVIPALEKMTGRAYDEDRCGRCSPARPGPRTTSCPLESAKHKPSPIDAYFAASTTSVRSSRLPRHGDAVDYYRELREEWTSARQGRAAHARRRARGEALPPRRRGPPNWTSFREFWKMFSDEGAVVVASTYTKVGGSTTTASATTQRGRSRRSPSTARAATRT